MKKLLLLFLLALPGTAIAACIDNATDIVFQEQGANLLAVIGLMVMLIAAAYAAGSVLTNMHYVVFAKDELYHLGISILMLVAFSGIVVFSCQVMDFFFSVTVTQMGDLPSGCYVTGSPMGEVSTCYMNLISKDARKMSEYHIQNYLDYMMDSTWSVGITWPLLNAYTVTAGAYKRVISTQYDTILNLFIIPALMSISMQKLALDFINANIIRWILPIAFLLRIFTPTRQMGDILIALCLALYILVPFMYVFNLMMYDALDRSITTPPNCLTFAGAVCDNVADSYGCGSPEVTCANPNGFWNVARLIPQAFFLPNLTIALVITFLGGVHKALRLMG